MDFDQMDAQKSKMEKLDFASMIIGLSLMLGLIIALSITLCFVCKRARFKFLITLIALLYISDVAMAFLSVGFYLETSEYH